MAAPDDPPGLPALVGRCLPADRPNRGGRAHPRHRALDLAGVLRRLGMAPRWRRSLPRARQAPWNAPGRCCAVSCHVARPPPEAADPARQVAEPDQASVVVSGTERRRRISERRGDIPAPHGSRAYLHTPVRTSRDWLRHTPAGRMAVAGGKWRGAASWTCGAVGRMLPRSQRRCLCATRLVPSSSSGSPRWSIALTGCSGRPGLPWSAQPTPSAPRLVSWSVGSRQRRWWYSMTGVTRWLGGGLGRPLAVQAAALLGG